MVVNILVMIHGMIPNLEKKSHFSDYNNFFNALQQEHSELTQLFESGFTHRDSAEQVSFIGVEWGHEPSNLQGTLRDDQKLTRAQNIINDRVSYDKLVREREPNNITLNLFGDFPSLTPVVRNLVISLRESIVTRGFGDVIYYSSSEGERRVRSTVYGQVLEQLDDYLNESEVRIHLMGQSLGVTLTHDFLYGLFNRDENYQPDFVENHQGSDRDVERFEKWRNKAQNGELKLGSLTSTASQLPLFVMRKQKLVDLLSENKLLKAADLGIVERDRVKWKLFYDVDDLIGFASRKLYDSDNAIMDIQVDSGDNPGDAHINYWKNKTVIEQTADLLLKNARL
jgi:hypothetical protein